MSQESWLFLFALFAALGGIAAFIELISKLATTKSNSGSITISRARGWFISALLLGSLILSILGFWTIYSRNQREMIPRTVQWAALADASGKVIGCQVVVDTSLIISLADKYDVVLVCGIPDPSIDELEDSRIAVGRPFNISGGLQHMADVFTNPELVSAVSSAGSNLSVWQRVVVVPKGTDLSEIKRLSDVPRFGGKLYP